MIYQVVSLILRNNPNKMRIMTLFLGTGGLFLFIVGMVFLIVAVY